MEHCWIPKREKTLYFYCVYWNTITVCQLFAVATYVEVHWQHQPDNQLCRASRLMWSLTSCNPLYTDMGMSSPLNVNLSPGPFSPLWPFLLLTPSSLFPRCWDLLGETCSRWFCHQLCINNNNLEQLLICNDTFITTAAAYNSLLPISY